MENLGPIPPARRPRIILASLIALAAAVSRCEGLHAAATAATLTARAALVQPPPNRPPTSRRVPRRVPVPILMYHVIGTPSAGTRYPKLWVTPALFAAQMRALDKAGYTGATLDAVLDNWSGGTSLPSRPIVVSFDDGFMGQERYGAPVLKRLGWRGVLNLVLAHVGRQGITAWRVRHLVRDGWEIDSHTLTHPDLTTLGPRALEHELTASRAALRRRFGARADVLCYSIGRFNATVVHAARRAGYRAATTEVPGLATPAPAQRYALPRVRVSGGESPAAVLESVRSPARHG